MYLIAVAAFTELGSHDLALALVKTFILLSHPVFTVR